MKTKTEIKNLKELKELGGKFKCTHKGEYDGRRQTVALIKIDGEYYQGNAQCSHKDMFSRKIGRAIALGRAMENYKEGRHMSIESIPEEWRFQEDRKKEMKQNA